VDPDRMGKNLEDNLGLVFSQRVLLSLLEKGVPRDAAYNMVRRNAEEAWAQQGDFQYLLLQDEEIRKYLSRQQIMEMFDYHWFIRYIDYIFERASIN
jgi:adenylosuccinate lyase